MEEHLSEHLYQAARTDHVPAVQWILQQPGVNVNANDPCDGRAALHGAASQGSVGTTRLLLQAPGINVDDRDWNGNSPLHFAGRGLKGVSVAHRQFEVIQALLEAGADPSVTNSNGWTPLFDAVEGPDESDNTDSVKALLDAGADPKVVSLYHETTLHRACAFGRPEALKLLIQRIGPELGSLISVKDDSGRTPLDCVGANRQWRIQVFEVAVRQCILQSYADMIIHSEGPLSLHAVLQNASLIEGNEDYFELAVGTLNTEELQNLLGLIVAKEPGSVSTQNSDGLLPLQVATQLNIPNPVLDVLSM